MENAEVPDPRIRLTPAQVDRLQRARILDALTEVVAAKGYGQTTIEDVADRGALSRKTFYRLFDNKADAFFAAHDAVVAQATRRMCAASMPDEKPEVRVRAALRELLAFVEARPDWARLSVLEAQVASALAGRGDRHLQPILAWVTRVCEELALTPMLPVEEQTAVVLGVLHARLAKGGERVDDLVDPFFRLTVGEIGRDQPVPARSPGWHGDPRRLAAIRESAKDPSGAPRLVELVVDAVVDHDNEALRAVESAAGDATVAEFRSAAWLARVGARGGAGEILRATGRAGRPAGSGLSAQGLHCLHYVAQHPGSSGREVQAGLGVRAESQVSRLLARLEGRGLLYDTGDASRGRWHLSEAGRAALEG